MCFLLPKQVLLQVATDSGLTNVVKNGTYNATVDSDYTVKVIANGLSPSASYFYNFIVPNGTIVSPTGKFRCANFFSCAFPGRRCELKNIFN